MKFEDYQLKPELIETLRQSGIESCTDIQKESIPHVLDGKDISGLSQTGSGKTFAFLVPLFDRILRSLNSESTDELDIKRRFNSWSKGHFVLILAPTRELADQIHKNVTLLCKNTTLKSVLVYGGVDYEEQTKAFSGGVDIVVGTPGRLIDLYKSHHLNFRQMTAVVFDEADRMFDMGFKEDMIYILQRAPKDRQILLFSATLNFDVTNTVYSFESHPVEINVSKDQVKAGEVVDEIYHLGEGDKPQYLISLIKKKQPKQTIIFSNFKNNVERISSFLNKNGVPAVGISSLLTQSQRERVLEQFKNENERNTLVATDVAARGLDIKGVDLVINYDLPDDAENYVHRIGRTGRAGAKGTAYSLVSDRDVPALGRIESYLKQKVTIGWMEDSDLIKEFTALPKEHYKRESSVRKTGSAAVKSSSGKKDFKKNKHRKYDSQDHRKSNDSSNESVHRDRKMGRHKNQNKTFSQGPAKKTESFRSPKKNNEKSYKKTSFKKSYSKPSSSAGIGKKIKSFIKNLFGK